MLSWPCPCLVGTPPSPGAIIGSGLTRGAKTVRCGSAEGGVTYTLRWPWLRRFANDVDRRDFISIGAAAGFAAAFGAPIGGILFALEEAASFFTPSLLWRALLATTTATFTLLVCQSIFDGVWNSDSDFAEVHTHVPPFFFVVVLLMVRSFGSH